MLESAESAEASGDTDKAITLTTEALRLQPAFIRSYHYLANLLATSESERSLQCCHRGVLPDSIIQRYFDTNFPSCDKDSDNPRITRHHCYVSERDVIPEPLSLNVNGSGLLKRTERQSSEALVDHLPAGALWFDGFNRVVLDKDQNLIEPHTRGNPTLIKSIVETHDCAHFDGRVFFLGNRGYNNFYHWMLDILPSIHLFEKSGYKIGPNDRVAVFNATTSFQRQSLEYLGISQEQVIELNKTSPFISADELVVPFFSNAMAMTMGSWIPKFLNDKFTQACSSEVPAGRKLYIARSSNARNGRAINNEDQFIDLLEKYGFESVLPEKLSLTEQAQLFASADVVVASHGAGLTNSVFCKPGTTIVELYGSYMETCYWAISALCGFRYIGHCCVEMTNAGVRASRDHSKIDELRKQGFSVQLDELPALLDLATKEKLQAA